MGEPEALSELDVYLRCDILTAWIEDGGCVYLLSAEGVTRNDYRPYLRRCLPDADQPL